MQILFDEYIFTLKHIFTYNIHLTVNIFNLEYCKLIISTIDFGEITQDGKRFWFSEDLFKHIKPFLYTEKLFHILINEQCNYMCDMHCRFNSRQNSQVFYGSFIESKGFFVCL